MKIFAATLSEVDKKYYSGGQSTSSLYVNGQVGMWVVWDVMVGQSGYFARLVPEADGRPLGFRPCVVQGEVLGYMHDGERLS